MNEQKTVLQLVDEVLNNPVDCLTVKGANTFIEILKMATPSKDVLEAIEILEKHKLK